ncbi:lysophospholipid acyltransferase family protein [Geminicoccaceae bacterium 1502E]|nr:lysophospholipid acyltransferase family protein [Geminicoccaceae bacterium 1502E]
MPLLAWARALAFNIAFYTLTVLMALAVLPAAPFMSAGAMRRYAGAWMRAIHMALRWTVGLRHEVRGLEHLPPEPVLIASKHQSAWETLFFHTVRPDMVFGLKHELGHIPLFGWYLKIARNIFIDRGGAAKALRSLVEGARRAIGEGASVLIFPEGTRSAPGAEPDYKSGVAALYAALGVKVVPVALNSGLFWPRRSFIKRPGTITVEFLEPIPAGLDRKSFMRLLEERIEGRATALLEQVPGR